MKDTKEVLLFVFKMITAGIDANADGNINMTDLFLVIPALQTATPAIADIQNVKSEFANMTIEEKTELAEFTREHFDLPTQYDQIELFIENCIDYGLGVFPLIRQLNVIRKAS